MTAPCMLLLRASLDVEIAWPGHACGWMGAVRCPWVWTNGWMVRRNSALSANLMMLCFSPSPRRPPRLLHPHPEPTTMAHAPLRQWSQLRMILHVRSHWGGLGWWAAVWFPVSRSGSSADPCKSCSSDRSSFLPSPRYCGTSGTSDTWGTSWPTPGSGHDTRPLRRTLVCRQFPTTLACDRGSQGLSAGGSRTGPPCKGTAKDHPDHVPSQRELEGTRRLRSSTLGPSPG